MNIGYLMPLVDGDGPVVVVRLFDRPPDLRAESLARARGRQTGPALLGSATVTLEVDAEDADIPTGKAVGVLVHSARGLDASELRQFPWRRVIASAVATHRARHLNTIEAWQTVGASQSTSDRSPRPPGRPPISPAHYQHVADRYRELVRQGDKAPVTQIAKDSVVSRNTAASWVSRARQRGFLEPATRGRPG